MTGPPIQADPRQAWVRSSGRSGESFSPGWPVVVLGNAASARRTLSTQHSRLSHPGTRQPELNLKKDNDAMSIQQGMNTQEMMRILESIARDRNIDRSVLIEQIAANVPHASEN